MRDCAVPLSVFGDIGELGQRNISREQSHLSPKTIPRDRMSQEASVKSSPQSQVISLATLPNLNLQQLTMFKQQLDQELGVFQDSLHTLKIAQSRFQESGSCLEKITPDTEGESRKFPKCSFPKCSFMAF